jgi:regulator of protease activity HflC (stomatin/prohibitin superfamily)
VWPGITALLRISVEVEAHHLLVGKGIEDPLDYLEPPVLYTKFQSQHPMKTMEEGSVITMPIRSTIKSIWNHKVAILIILAAVATLTVAAFGFGTVGTGEAVILVDPIFKSISPEATLGPSFYVKWPWASAIRIMYSIQSVSMVTEYVQTSPNFWAVSKTGDYPGINVLSKDGLQIEVDIQIRWSLDPTKLVALFRNYPALDYKDVVITSITREVIRDAIAQFTALEVVEKRANITVAIQLQLKEALMNEPSLAGAINTLEVDLRNIDPPFSFLQAVASKITAQQKALEAEYNKTAQLILANATAQKQLILAKANAEAMEITANATARSIYYITRLAATDATTSERLTELYLTLEALKEIAATDSRLILLWGTQTPGLIIPPQ